VGLVHADMTRRTDPHSPEGLQKSAGGISALCKIWVELGAGQGWARSVAVGSVGSVGSVSDSVRSVPRQPPD